MISLNFKAVNTSKTIKVFHFFQPYFQGAFREGTVALLGTPSASALPLWYGHTPTSCGVAE